jgi:hypothetical protein
VTVEAGSLSVNVSSVEPKPEVPISKVAAPAPLSAP